MYIIIELQTAKDGTVGNIVKTATNINLADQIYHTALAAAAVSSIYCHSVCMLSADGAPIKHETYWHKEA